MIALTVPVIPFVPPHPTDPFTILELQDQEIGDLYLIQKRRAKQSRLSRELLLLSASVQTLTKRSIRIAFSSGIRFGCMGNKTGSRPQLARL